MVWGIIEQGFARKRWTGEREMDIGEGGGGAAAEFLAYRGANWLASDLRYCKPMRRRRPCPPPNLNLIVATSTSNAKGTSPGNIVRPAFTSAIQYKPGWTHSMRRVSHSYGEWFGRWYLGESVCISDMMIFLDLLQWRICLTEINFGKC